MKSRYFPDFVWSASSDCKERLYSSLAEIFSLSTDQIRKSVVIPIYGGLGDSIPALVFSSYISSHHHLNEQNILYLLASSKKSLLELFQFPSPNVAIVDDNKIPYFAPLAGFGRGRVAFSTKTYIFDGSIEPLISAHSIPFLDIIKASFKLPLTLPYKAKLRVDMAQVDKYSVNNLFDSNKINIILFPYSSYGRELIKILGYNI